MMPDKLRDEELRDAVIENGSSFGNRWSGVL